jgi:signal peptidase I
MNKIIMSVKLHPSKHRSWLKECLYWFFIVLGGILLAIVLRVYFFAAFVIPTPLMEPAIIPGDKVMVNKQIPGPRIIRNFFSLHRGEKPDIKRLKGMRAVRRNDVLIFNFPYSDWNRLEMDMGVFYAKRCVFTRRATSGNCQFTPVFPQNVKMTINISK